MALNYIEQLLVLASAVSRCVSISAFTSLVDIPIGIVSSAVVLKIGAITTGIKKYKLIIQKKKKKHDKLVLLVKKENKQDRILTFQGFNKLIYQSR